MAAPAQARVDTHFITMRGGLDQVSAATLVKEGFLIDAQNYEIDSVNGGYGRINGYERFDGRTSPSAASYWHLPADIFGAVAVGNTITGQTSGATGNVLYVGANFLILGSVTGTFQSAENLQVSGVIVAESTAVATENGASVAADHASFSLLAANEQRALIGAVPGTGPVLGVWLYKDNLYAWRNNAGGTAAVMHKATTSGWSAVPMFKEIAFTTGLVKTAEGAVLHGTTSLAKGTVKRIVTRTGTWGSNAQGYVVIDVTSGTFQSGETLKLTDAAGAVQMTSASVANNIAFAPNGSFEFANYNFTGSTDTYRMYGCDGQNPAFEFDGTILAFIRTGMATDKPSHIAAHQNYLFLSFRGSLQNSAIGDPYGWTLLAGSSEIGAGDDITALLPQPGDANNASMSIFSNHSTRTLYGVTASSWKLVTDSPTTGAAAKTAQFIGAAYALAERGVQQIRTTMAFGDFQYATITGQIQPTINSLRGTAVASTVYKERNQYRIFYSNGTALAITMSGADPIGSMVVRYSKPPVCYCTGAKSDGREYSWFGASDGYVYQDNVGTSFDGDPIEAWIRLPFHHFGSPRHIKTFRKASLDITSGGFTGFSFSHELYGGDHSVDVSVIVDDTLDGRGGYWDQFNWDEFSWDSAAVLHPAYDLYGSERNISLLFYSNSAIYSPHSIQGVHFDYSTRRLAR